MATPNQPGGDQSLLRDNAPTEPLRTIYFYLTEGCNLACSHCWLSPQHDPAGTKYSSLPIHLFQEIIEQALPLGLEGVKLTGGEPFLHPRFGELLDIIYSRQLELTIETNGILCTPELAATIARHRNPYISISLDAATPELHDHIRGVQGAYRKTVRALETFISSGIATQIIMTIRRENCGQIKQMVHLADTLGAHSLKFNFLQPVGRGKSLHQAEKAVSIAELIGMERTISEECAGIERLSIVYSTPPAFKALRTFLPENNDNRICGISSILGVLSNGVYALCGIGTQVSEMTFGHAGEIPLATVWAQNPVLREIRNGLPHKFTGVCGRCLMKQACFGSCLALNYARSGSIWSPFWFCEEAEKRGLFPESRLT